jgi:hypothetical protein
MVKTAESIGLGCRHFRRIAIIGVDLFYQIISRGQKEFSS